MSRTLLIAFAALTAASIGTAACGGGGSLPAPPSPATAPSSPVSGTVPTQPPTPTPTEDALGPRPADGTVARARLHAFLAGLPAACNGEVGRRWSASCVPADFDGDAIPDVAYLVPVGGQRSSPQPAAVLVRRGATTSSVELIPAGEADADASALGRAFFSSSQDRSGDGVPDLTFISTGCGASTCNSQILIVRWDGTAWRNIGPADSFPSLEGAVFAPAASGAVLTVRAGTIASVGAGPTRVTTSTFVLSGGVFALQAAIPDRPVYLVHAIADADALATMGKLGPSLAAFRALQGNTALKDWRLETGQAPGRDGLMGYVLYRIAVLVAALGEDPTAAFDAAITGGKEPLFVEGVQAFRRGFQERSTVTAGCIEATRYFSLPASRSILREIFDYGYANRRPEAADMCPF
jgi:hypothetical protein